MTRPFSTHDIDLAAARMTITGEQPSIYRLSAPAMADDAPEVVPEHTAPVLPGLKMKFSTFTRKTSSIAKPLILDKQAFITLLAKHIVRADKDGKLFSPATFIRTRTNDHFISASGICLDFDNGQPSIHSVLELLPGTLAAYHSTHSHTSENPRFRVVIPLSRPVNADEHGRLVAGVKSIITHDLNECIDSTCFERARPHYLPSCPPELELHAFASYQDGDPLDVELFLSLGDSVANVTSKPMEQRPAPASSDTQPPALDTISTFDVFDPATGEQQTLVAWAAQNPGFDLLAAFDSKYFRGKPNKDGKQHIACPFENQHTDQDKDLATFIVNATPPQYDSWDIHCCHAHCVGRDRLEFIKAFVGKGWLPVNQLQTATTTAIEKKRPPKVYFHINDTRTDPAWTALLPNERRVALDLTTMCWAEIDGMIENSDWVISRLLGMTIEEWQPYRATLARTGWLIESEGRVTNTIVKREFDRAQDAYMKGLAKSSKGGKTTQENARSKSTTQVGA